MLDCDATIELTEITVLIGVKSAQVPLFLTLPQMHYHVCHRNSSGSFYTRHRTARQMPNQKVRELMNAQRRQATHLRQKCCHWQMTTSEKSSVE